MDLIKLFNQGKYEDVIREIDSRFGWSSEELGREDFTREEAEWCLKQINTKQNLDFI